MTPALDLVIRSAVVMGVGLAVASLLRGTSAAVKHRVLAATVVASLVLPGLALVAPIWSLPSLGERREAPRAASASTPTPNVASSTTFLVETTVTAGAQPARARNLMQVAWFAGAVLLCAPLAAGLWRLRRLALEGVLDTGAWADEANRMGALLGLTRHVRVLHGTRPDLLVAWGWRRPTVLLPPRAAAWSPERRRVVLAHELAHLVRGDWVVQLAADLARAMYWCNPLAWMLCRQLRAQSEYACDDHVLRHGIAAVDYAAHLVEIARELQPQGLPALPAPAMARSTRLEGRVRAMLTASRNHRPASPAATLAIAAASALLAVAIAGAQSLVQVSGAIVDPSGRVLPGVAVSLTDAASASRFEVRSDREGRYLFVGVPPADYTFTVEQPGFQSVKEPMHVTGATTRDVSMVIGTIRETLSVRGVGTPASAGDLADRRAKAKAEFDKFAAMGTAPCRASGAPAVGGNILAPRKLVDVKVLYPADLYAAGISGTVTLTAVIGTDGTVRDIADVHGPHPGLEAAAAAAVREWQYSTTYLNCEPIEVKMMVTTNFLQ